jgi:hypothetical protein
VNPDDETTLSEITIMPDGRVYIFGASAPVLDALVELNPADALLRRRVRCVRASCRGGAAAACGAGSHEP